MYATRFRLFAAARPLVRPAAPRQVYVSGRFLNTHKVFVTDIPQEPAIHASVDAMDADPVPTASEKLNDAKFEVEELRHAKSIVDEDAPYKAIHTEHAESHIGIPTGGPVVHSDAFKSWSRVFRPDDPMAQPTSNSFYRGTDSTTNSAIGQPPASGSTTPAGGAFNVLVNTAESIGQTVLNYTHKAQEASSGLAGKAADKAREAAHRAQNASESIASKVQGWTSKP